MTNYDSKVIYKYKLEITDYQKIYLPIGSKILSVANQREQLCLWALVDPDANFGEHLHHVEIIGTGNPIPPVYQGMERVFLGTVVIEPFVWHVFEQVEKKTPPAPKAPPRPDPNRKGDYTGGGSGLFG